MKKVDEILKEKIISKSSSIASPDENERILKQIVIVDEIDTEIVFKKIKSPDEKIDDYFFWKSIFLNNIVTETVTENYSYKHYCCCFLDTDATCIVFAYIFHEGELYDISQTVF